MPDGQPWRSGKAQACAASSGRVLYVTPELADYVKAGGLGEVSASLPRVLRSHCDARVLIPGYRQVLRRASGLEIVGELPAAHGLPACRLGRTTLADGLIVYVLVCPELYDRPGGPYTDPQGADWPDNDLRFARLSLAAADMTCGLGDPGWHPDLLHLNDWPSALAPGYLAWRGGRTPTLLTIHNLAYQGLFGRGRLSPLGIPMEAFHINGVEFHGKISFLKAGIYYASHVTTVSSTYAREITRPEFGCGLHGLLRGRAEEGRLTGILNGIEALPGPAEDTRKEMHAEQVRTDFRLRLTQGPLFAIVSRLVHQKGVDLAIEATAEILAKGGQLVVIGEGEPRFEDAMARLARRHPGHVGVHIGFEQEQARRMYAASDFLLMPSRFEPCGLSQMYAQRSGSLPIAHRTGGLADTIQDGVTGFLFGSPSVAGLIGAIRRALHVFRSRSRLEAMRRIAMAQPFDWEKSAGRYAAIYRSARPGADVLGASGASTGS